MNPLEFIKDMMDLGHSKEEAIALAKIEAKHRRDNLPEDIKARNDSVFRSRGLA